MVVNDFSPRVFALQAGDLRHLAALAAYLAGHLRPDFPDEVTAAHADGEDARLLLGPSADVRESTTLRVRVAALRRLLDGLYEEVPA